MPKELEKCIDGDCPVKESCLRYSPVIKLLTEKHFSKPPYNWNLHKCEFHIQRPFKTPNEKN